MKFLLWFFVLNFFVVSPSLSLYADQTDEIESYSVVVIGGGIGGLTSALYLARSGIDPLVIEGSAPGGLLKQSHSVQNWPGEIEIEGTALIDKVRHQASQSGAQFLSEDVISVDFSKTPFIISSSSSNGGKIRRIKAGACIIAMGTEPRFLTVPGETGADGYWGRGVTNCAVCDGPLYKGKKVGVVGGGDAAILEALYLSNIAKEVFVFVRKNQLKTTEKKRLESLLEKNNIKVLYQSEVISIHGNKEEITGVSLKTKDKKPYLFPLDGLFLAIGSTPNSSIFKNSLKLDKEGYILLEKDQQTSQKGVYAIGDIVDPVYKQAVSASGDGAKAALQAQQFVEANSVLLNKNERLEEKKTPLKVCSIEITNLEQFERELNSGENLTVVDFYAPWCGPCRYISPLLDSLSEKFPARLKILKVNVDQFPDLSKSYQIKSLPTLLIFNASSELVERKSGTGEITQALKEIEDNLGNPKN